MVGKTGSMPVRETVPEELPRERLSRDGRPGEVRVEPIEEFRPNLRGRAPGPEAPNPCFPKEVVPGEHFVGTFSGQNDLYPTLADEARQQKQRRCGRSEKRPLGMCHDLGKTVGDIPTPDEHIAMITSEGGH